MEKKFYNKEDIKNAENIPILDVARDLGLTLIKMGRCYGTKEISSLRIYPESNTFCRFSLAGEKMNNTINLVETVRNCEFKEAMNFLYNNNSFSFDTSFEKNSFDKKEVKIERKDFKLPKFNKDLKRTYAYLLKTRKIDKEIVDECVKIGNIREDERHNICFLGKDKNGKAKYCAFNGTITNKRFKGEVEGSDKAYSFNINNKSDKLIICESPIDVLSVMTILKEKGSLNDFSYISLSGITEVPIDHFLEENKNVKELLFMLDNDDKGKKGFERLKENFKESYKVQSFSYLYENFKDINDYLIQKVLDEEKKLEAKEFEEENSLEQENEYLDYEEEMEM